jgi:hypothetical protein
MSGILVIKFGSLGDIVQATGPFTAIRKHHARERITLLTTAPARRALHARLRSSNFEPVEFLTRDPVAAAARVVRHRAGRVASACEPKPRFHAHD